jgi:type IV pilus assembly protein PilM
MANTRHIVAVDFDRTAIRALEARASKNGTLQVRAYHEVALPEGVVLNGEVTEPATVATILKKLWKDARFSTKNVMLGMGEQRVVARDLVMPQLSAKETRALLPKRVQELIPMPVSDAIIDFYPVAPAAPTTEGPMVRGLLVAAYAEAVRANVSMVERAGLRVVGVDFLPFALQRAVGSRDGGVTAIVEIGVSSTNVVVSVRGVPDFVRIIPIGGDDVLKTLMAAVGVSQSEAHHLLMSAPRADENPAIVGAISEAMAELLTSIVNTLRYYSNTHDGVAVATLVVTGIASRMRSVENAIAQRTGIRLEEPTPFAHVKLPRALRGFGPTEARKLGAAFGLALGARA